MKINARPNFHHLPGAVFGGGEREIQQAYDRATASGFRAAMARGMGGVIEDAERAAREAGIELTCKEEAVWFPDMLGGPQYYINRVCAAPGTGYNFSAAAIAAAGGVDVLKQDLANQWHYEPVEVVQIDPALNYQLPAGYQAPVTIATTNKPNQSTTSDQPGVVKVKDTSTGTAPRAPGTGTTGEKLTNGLTDQQEREQSGLKDLLPSFNLEGNQAVLLAGAVLAALILFKGGKG